jgi:hypothetical protein
MKLTQSVLATNRVYSRILPSRETFAYDDGSVFEPLGRCCDAEPFQPHHQELGQAGSVTRHLHFPEYLVRSGCHRRIPPGRWRKGCQTESTPTVFRNAPRRQCPRWGQSCSEWPGTSCRRGQLYDQAGTSASRRCRAPLDSRWPERRSSSSLRTWTGITHHQLHTWLHTAHRPMAARVVCLDCSIKSYIRRWNWQSVSV